MEKPIILIIDSDKLTKEEWDELFKKCVVYAAWMHPDDYNEITSFVDANQDKRYKFEYKKKQALQNQSGEEK